MRAKALGKEGETVTYFPFFFLPSLDAKRSRLNLPINHRATIKAAGYESGLCHCLEPYGHEGATSHTFC